MKKKRESPYIYSKTLVVAIAGQGKTPTVARENYKKKKRRIARLPGVSIACSRFEAFGSRGRQPCRF